MHRTLVICALVSLSLPVHAQTPPASFEVTPYGGISFGGTFTDADTDIKAELEDSASFGIVFDIRQGSNTQWEILYAQQQTDADITGLADGDESLDLRVHYLQIGGTYQGEGGVARPYLAATLGAAHFDVKTAGYDSDTFFSFSIGPGLQIRPNERLGLRLEARLFGSLIRSDSTLFCISNPGGATAGCAITVTGDVLWQVQTFAGVVFRF